MPQVVAIPKTEYKKIIENQKRLVSQFSALQKLVVDALNEPEIKPSVLKRLDKISKEMDQGAGKRFNSLASFRAYLSKL